jgi:hypothetical protein
LKAGGAVREGGGAIDINNIKASEDLRAREET